MENNKLSLNLPSDTMKIFNCKNKWDNIYLLHNRYLYLMDINKPRKQWYMSIDTRNTHKEINHKELTSLISHQLKLTKALAERTKCERYKYIPVDKLIIGVGGASPYGNIQLLRLHHVYRIPYIPATALKGAMRNCWLCEIGSDEQYFELFGTTDDDIDKEAYGNMVNLPDRNIKGALIFYDIFPIKYEIDFDVQTPHFSEYYMEGKEPTDDLNPIPITFTCINNTEFDIWISCMNKELWDYNKNKIDMIMKYTLEEYGIGAKTSYGYGIGKEML